MTNTPETIIAEHRWRDGKGCNCGWFPDYRNMHKLGIELHAAHVVSRLAAHGHTIVPTPATSAFRDATRELIGNEAWVFGISETELRDVITRAVLAAAVSATQ